MNTKDRFPIRRSRYSDHTPMKYPGMFPSENAKLKAPACRLKLFKLFTVNTSDFLNISPQRFRAHIKEKFILDLIGWYEVWERDDDRFTDADLKASFSEILSTSEQLSKLVENASPDARRAFNHLLEKHRRNSSFKIIEYEEFVENLKLSCDELVACLTPVIEKRHPRRGTTKIRNAGSILATKWEKMTGLEFKWNHALIDPRRGDRYVSDIKEFASDSMHFVHVALQAIDPLVTGPNVSSGMRRKPGPRPRTR